VDPTAERRPSSDGMVRGAGSTFERVESHTGKVVARYAVASASRSPSATVGRCTATCDGTLGPAQELIVRGDPVAWSLPSSRPGLAARRGEPPRTRAQHRFPGY
jgi:hypothetical protein